jgi:hypothetical protein
VIQLLALAVVETPGVELETLPCVVRDVRQVYGSLGRICADSFDGLRSYVGINPSASQARELMLLAAASAEADDILVVYVSSHGVLRAGTLSIPFNDARSNGFGFLEAGEISSALRRCRGQVLLILDCCFAGAALREAYLRDIYDTPKISIIASALPYGRASYGVDGSHFTQAFVRAVERIGGDGEAITVSRIVECVQTDDAYSGEVLINLAEGLADLQLAPSPGWYQDVAVRKDFETRFLDRVARSPRHTREMLWYSLDGMPDSLKFKIFRSFRGHPAMREPSWLVRRAMGTVLSRTADIHPAKRASILDLLNARNWTHVCVGLVAGRHAVEDPDVALKMKRLLSDARQMDVTWLANLYLADYSIDSLPAAVASPLGKTAWGVVDLWKRYAPHYDDPAELASMFAEAARGRPDLLQDLRIHLDCTGSAVGSVLGVASTPDVIDNELVRFQYAREPRGVLAQTPVKWLVSSLYGSWRDQLTGDLREYLDNTEKQQVVLDLNICRRIPSVEHRVSVCLDLAEDAAGEPEILGAARWAVTDPHPWVRREGLKLFPGDRQLAESAISVVTDKALFPGYVDLALEAHRNGAGMEALLRTMTKADRESVLWATSVETSQAW